MGKFSKKNQKKRIQSQGKQNKVFLNLLASHFSFFALSLQSESNQDLLGFVLTNAACLFLAL
ncbi:hypothetical protein [Geoalkalibacter halelectricus]|uniref:hypothetical protein n=1 Tax=Geoalkalibacter halelectricus TaxID=2847045 RepID=UPI003D21A116